jgi:hypothetical protein
VQAESLPPCISYQERKRVVMKTTKFVVKVSHGSTRAPAYVQRIDRTPVRMTTNRKLALMMGRFTAEDAVKSIQTSKCRPELVPVVSAAGGSEAERSVL